MHSVDDLLNMVCTEAFEGDPVSEVSCFDSGLGALGQDLIAHDLRLVEDEEGWLHWSE